MDQSTDRCREQGWAEVDSVGDREFPSSFFPEFVSFEKRETKDCIDISRKFRKKYTIEDPSKGLEESIPRKRPKGIVKQICRQGSVT